MQQARRERALPCLALYDAATRLAAKRQQTLGIPHWRSSVPKADREVSEFFKIIILEVVARYGGSMQYHGF
jgi:hypothetical protein